MNERKVNTVRFIVRKNTLAKMYIFSIRIRQQPIPFSMKQRNHNLFLPWSIPLGVLQTETGILWSYFGAASNVNAGPLNFTFHSVGCLGRKVMNRHFHYPYNLLQGWIALVKGMSKERRFLFRRNISHPCWDSISFLKNSSQYRFIDCVLNSDACLSIG